MTAAEPEEPPPTEGRPLRILLASVAPFMGGAEVAAERLAVGLEQAGHQVHVLLGTRGIVLDRFREIGLHCDFAELPLTDRKKIVSYTWKRWGLRRRIKQLQPDIIHSNDLPTHQFVSNAARGLGIPRICHHRWIFPGGGIDWMNKFGAERHLYVSKGLMNELYGNSPRLAATSGAVLYDGLPLPVPPTEADQVEAKRKLGLGPEPVVLFAGQIIERKGVADLLHAWKQLEERGCKAQLVIVGDDVAGKGAYRIEMEKLARDLGVSAAFKGFQTNVADWLIASDVVMVPSHAEPLGNATLEAMAQCRPVIGGDVGGIPEMVVHEETGLLVPPKSPGELASAIERLLSQPEEAKRFGQAARGRCEELFSLEAHIRNVVAEYRRLLPA